MGKIGKMVGENPYINEDVLQMEEDGEMESEDAGFMLGFNDAIPAEV